MMRRITSLLLFVVVCICCTPIFAQDKVARDRLIAAHAQYYTPTASGLQSFQCEATIDWKAMLTRFSRTEVPDDNPVLKYLKTVQLIVADQLNGKGSMEWTETGGVPPEGKEENLKQMRDGLQIALAGFFQSWNSYMNGSMVPIPDSKVTVTTAGSGVHLSGAAGGTRFDEDFDKNMLLTQVLVVSPEVRVLAIPSYVDTADGLVISSVTSQINQPPSAPQTEITFRVEYAKVDSFQMPSNLVLDIKNLGIIEVGFNACHVSIAEWARKPTAEKSHQIN